MVRWVLHIDMDAFFASVEQLTRPTLQGRPVLVAGVTGRGVVAGASYEARKLGAHSAMPTMRAARLIGPRGVIVSPRKDVYSLASSRVFEVVRSRVGIIERLSIDEAYMEPEELIGASPAEVREWANKLRALIRAETGLPASIGAGSGKQFAKIGSGQAKPNGVFIIPHDKQLEIIHPMDVAKLWGVGPVTEAKLHDIGVRTIGELAAMSQREVEISLGSTIGVALWELARGIDDRPVLPRAEAKQTSAEHTYPQDLTTTDEVTSAIIRAAHDAHRRLLRQARAARTVTVKLRMADFHIESRSATLPYATDDLDTLTALAFRVARYPGEVGPIRLVGVSYSGFDTTAQQVLFPELDQRIGMPSAADYETGVGSSHPEPRIEMTEMSAPIGDAASPTDTGGYRATQDVHHAEYGHGWVQGVGLGRLTVRFETRATGAGRTKSLSVDDPDLRPCDPVESLAWQDWIAQRENEDPDAGGSNKALGSGSNKAPGSSPSDSAQISAMRACAGESTAADNTPSSAKE